MENQKPKYKIDPDDPVTRKYMEIAEVYKNDQYKSTPVYEELLQYPLEDVIELYTYGPGYALDYTMEEKRALLEKFKVKVAHMKKLDNPPKPIYLWPDGKMPQKTKYVSNEQRRYTHNPDYKPHMFEILLPEDVTPKGAVIMCPGGEQSDNVLPEGYGSALEMRARGYQCFLLLNRTNGTPWCGEDTGADIARAIQIIRANAKKYRIQENQVAFAGFSNGGLSGEVNIQYYSGTQTIKDHYSDYEPDEYDNYYGSPDVFICVYGPRMEGASYSYEKVKYPPTIFAVGMEDKAAIKNLAWHCRSLDEQHIFYEVHTFAGAPHGIAGRALVDGKERYPGFALWTALADEFMQRVYK